MCFFILFAVFLLIVIFAHWSGLFYRPQVHIGKPTLEGSLRIAFKAGRGPYKHVRPFFDEIFEIYPNGQAIGIYYDDPGSVLQTNLRWLVGMITQVNGKHVISKNVEGELKSKNYHFAEIPAIKKAILSKFPSNKIFSNFVAPLRIYPAIKSYGKQTGIFGIPAIEFYNVTEGFIEYAMPITDNELFLVKEIKEMI